MKRLQPDTKTASHFCIHQDWFEVNRTYQREEVWSKKDKQYLIDTIMKKLDMPKIYLRVIEGGKFEIVDGQQRLKAIWDFFKNKFPLDPAYSGALGGKKYENLPREVQVDNFDNFILSVCYLYEYSDEDVRSLFRRLQKGKPLNTAERLNAFPGSITLLMRKLSHHKFFANTVYLTSKRYRHYQVVARLLLLEEEETRDVKPSDLEDFFDRKKNLAEDSGVGKWSNRVLNFLSQSFPDNTPELNSEVWIITLYLLVSDLLKNYVLDKREGDIANFYKSFWRKVQDDIKNRNGEDERVREFTFLLIGAPVPATHGDNIKKRLKIIEEAFLELHPDLILKDPKREFTSYEKIVIFRENEKKNKGETKCEKCGKKVDWEDYEGDHIYPYSKGGPTTIENGQVLCRACNRKKGAKI